MVFASRFQKGQTLIEVLAAFGVAVSLVSAITVTVIFALSTAQSSKNKNLATQDAQQGMEIVRRMQDVGGLQDLANGTYCLSTGGVITTKGALPNCPPDENTFVRQLTIVDSTLCDPAKQLTIDVYWSDSKCNDPHNLYCHKTEISSCLSGTSSVSTPGQIQVSVTPTAQPNPPSGLYGGYDQTRGYITLYWPAIVGATSYSLYCCNSGGSCQGGAFATIPSSIVSPSYTIRDSYCISCPASYFAISVNVAGSGSSAVSSPVSVSTFACSSGGD